MLRGFEREYWAWCDEAKERYDERLAILCDGLEPTTQMHRVAQMEARMLHVHTVAERACSGPVSFGLGSPAGIADF
jgi:hypothetical protein